MVTLDDITAACQQILLHVRRTLLVYSRARSGECCPRWSAS
jgi:hypothetical protein